MRALLLHGLSSSPAGWWRVRELLEGQGADVEAVALLGHDGRGPAGAYGLDDYVSDAFRAGPHDLVVGHSLGGAVATVLAAREPAWAARLVLLDPVWYVPAGRLAEVAAEQLHELEWTPESLRAARPHWDERDIAAKISAGRSVEPAAVGRTFAEARSWDIRPAASALRTPTLVIGGDPAVYTMTEPADVRAASEASGTIEYVVVDDAGHSPHRDMPDATMALLTGWLERTRWNDD